MLIAQYPMLDLSEQIFPSKLANYSGLRIGTEHCLNEIRENELSSDAEPILSFDSKPSPDNPRIPSAIAYASNPEYFRMVSNVQTNTGCDENVVGTNGVNTIFYRQRTEDISSSSHVICIPKVSNKITKQYIFGVFCSLKIGFIEKLTEIPIKTDPLNKRIFIKVKWNQSELSKYIHKRFDAGENVKVVYSDPWYWICVSNTR